MALIWWLAGDERLTLKARAAIDAPESEIFVSAASAYEIALKHRYGKLPQADNAARAFSYTVALEGFHELPVTCGHAQMAGQIENGHRDPFDRFLIAQAITEGMTLVSNARVFDSFGVSRLW